jgi:Uma2 family endonuclease
VPEVWIVDPRTRAVEVYTPRGESYVLVSADPDGAIRAPLFALVLQTPPGPKLRVGDAEI